MTHWFTADTHFDWEKIQVNLRGFASLEAANETILDEINWSVQKGDTLHILGDFAKREGHWANRLPKCHKVFIMGNHDNYNRVCKNFPTDHIHQTKLIKPESGTFVFLSHYPHIAWDRSHYGSYSLYGHVHGAREEHYDMLMPERKSMDVGVDNAYRLLGEWRPFAWEEIKYFLKDRKGHDPVEWYKKNRGELK